MGLLDGLKKAVGIAGEQLTYSSKKPQGIYFTNNFEIKAKQWGLSEKDALDVYYHGQNVFDNRKGLILNLSELACFPQRKMLGCCRAIEKASQVRSNSRGVTTKSSSFSRLFNGPAESTTNIKGMLHKESL